MPGPALMLLVALAAADKKAPPPPAKAPAPAPVAVEARAESRPTIERVGASVEYFSEQSRMSGEQWINNFRSDESFDYRAGPLAATLYLLIRPTERIRVGPAVRFLGNYGGRDYTFGYLTELALQGDFSLHAFEKVDAVFGARAGVSVLFPGEEFSEEIRRLQSQRADVWNVPRAGWVAGLSVGARRHIAGHLYARFDIHGQLGHHFLFLTDQIVDGLRFRKYWGNDIRRLGFNLGIEVAF